VTKQGASLEVSKGEAALEGPTEGYLKWCCEPAPTAARKKHQFYKKTKTKLTQKEGQKADRSDGESVTQIPKGAGGKI